MISSILEDNSINEQLIQNFVDDLCPMGADYSDLYFQYSISESWILEDGIVKGGSYNISNGVGTRTVSGEKTGFAYSDEISISEIAKAVKFARQIVNSNQKNNSLSLNKNLKGNFYSEHDPLKSISAVEKVSLLKKIDIYARREKYVKQVNASLTGSYSDVLIASSDDVFQSDKRPMVRLNISLILEKNGRVEHSSYGGGGRFSYKIFTDDALVNSYVDEAIRLGKVALDSVPAPAGVMPVILGPGWPGVLLHEAIGHGLEGDFNRKKTSVFSNLMNQQVASPKCTIVDNGTLKDRRGSLNIDDEGTATQSTTLIENGILKGYMFDKLNARLMGVSSTGNARRESYAHIPMPRMTNTYMQAGEDKVSDMISSIDNGIYALNFDGGQVDITSGKFVFSANEAYMIQNGKIASPIKGATLIGQGHEALKKISMVGDDLALDNGIGVCGKDGQSVPVGVGQPSLKIDALTVGGTEV
jgi:TldD protein